MTNFRDSGTSTVPTDNFAVVAEAALTEGSAQTSGSSAPVKSLCKQSYLEALRYKWIESEKAGCDVGEIAIGRWLSTHWHGWCRAKWLEHIMGESFWAEFPRDAFGALANNFTGDRVLLDRILDRLRCGCENLDVILWASEWKVDVDAVIDILTLIDVNRARINPSELFASETV